MGLVLSVLAFLTTETKYIAGMDKARVQRCTD